MMKRFGSIAGTCVALWTATAPAQAEVNLTSVTGSAGSPVHVTTLYLAEQLAKKDIANLQVLEGVTFTNSIPDVAEKRTDISPAPLILTFLLQKGQGPFSALGPEKGAELAGNLRALYPYQAGAYTLMAFESSGIRDWQDLRGKTILNGPPRGAALIGGRQQIQLAAGLKDGEDYKGIQVDLNQVASMMAGGGADAYMWPMTFPSEKITAAQAAGNIVLFSTPKDVWESEGYQRIFNAPGNVPVELTMEGMGYANDPGVRLVSEDGVFRSFGVAFADVVNKDMDFDLAKAITAAYIAGLDELKVKAPMARNMNIGNLDAKASGFCGLMPVPYHPGAVAAWEEAGYIVPDCAK